MLDLLLVIEKDGMINQEEIREEVDTFLLGVSCFILSFIMIFIIMKDIIRYDELVAIVLLSNHGFNFESSANS